MNNPLFVKYTSNPSIKPTGDCVVRALTLLENSSWLDVYDELCAIGREMYAMPSSDQVWQEFLGRRGFKKNPMPKITIGKTYNRLTVNEFASEHPKGTFIIRIANHVVTVKDGKFYDTWDCGSKSCGNYWSVS